MGLRRAFRTAPPKGSSHDGDEIFKSSDPPPPLTPSLSASRIPRLGGKLNLFTSSSNPSTPRLRCRTDSVPSSVIHISGTHSPSTTSNIDEKQLQIKSPKSSLLRTNPPSPKLALLRNSFRSRKGCGVCSRSVKSGRGTAVYTAQCGHVYHFPCIATHVRGTAGKKLACLVCCVEWSYEPLLAVHQNLPRNESQRKCRNAEIQEKQVISTTPKPQFHHCQSRPVPITCYSDDEPLSSPLPEAVFNPILKWEVGGEETSLITNKHTSQSSRTSVSMRLMPESAMISSTLDHQTCAVALKVKALQLPHTPRSRRRAPIDLVTVLDVSGSMMGGKMRIMRRAMRLVISSLGPQDRLSIVAFSAAPKRLLPLRKMTPPGQRAARSIVERLESSQGSCVGEALREAAKVLEDRRERNSVATIILFSDCLDDRPESQRPAPPAVQAAHHSTTRFTHVELPIDSPGDEMFAKWVGGLLSVAVQDLRIELGLAHRSAPAGAEITAVYCPDRQASLLRSNSVHLGDLYDEEERELLIQILSVKTMTPIRLMNET
uniref:Uncharacterized protein n=1 Tax=Kalanchoe fedtschenkoi TaxID=63787 RepID=A0A7N0UDE9_KALFE